MIYDLINPAKLRRALVYLLFLALVFLVQDLIVSHFPLLGIKPMMVPAAVVVIGLYEGASWGGFLGMAVGFFADMGYTEQTVLFTVLFTLAGFTAGVLGKYLLRRGIVSFLALFAAALALISLCQMFPFFFTDTRKWILIRTGLIQTLYSLPWSLIVYWPCRAIARRSDS